MDPLNNDQYQETKKQSKNLALRMRCMLCTMQLGLASIRFQEIKIQIHIILMVIIYLDSALQRFQKDYAAFDRKKRQQQKMKRAQQIQKKRLQYLQRQNKRWEVVQENERMKEEKLKRNIEQVQQGRKRTANSNGLAYNPINLTYDHNTEGEKLRLLDEDHKVRGYVRAYNMDSNGNGPYNPLNGEQRVGVNKIVPNQLNRKYQQRLNQFEQSRKLKVPQTSNQQRRNIFQYY